MRPKFHGVAPALITPMLANGQVDYQGLKRLIQHVTDGGVDYMGDGGMYTIIGPYISYLPTVNLKAPNEKALGWGGTFGLGSRVTDHIFIEGRYNFNGNIWTLGNDNTNLYGFRNTTIALSLGYLF